jgi:sulfatase modifying factor 1
VNRGGSWNADAWNCRAAIRNANEPENRNDNLGFRLARSSAGKVDTFRYGTGNFPDSH